MRSKAEITMVPRELIVPMWPHLAPFVERGADAARMTPYDAINGVVEGRGELWALAMGGKIAGVFLTTVGKTEDGRQFVGVSCLAGNGAWKWARLARDTVIEYGRSMGCEVARFYGRSEWLRFFPDFRRAGSCDGIGLYERAI